MARKPYETPTAAMSRLQAKVKTDYAEKVLAALAEIVEDRKAPAPARATAGTTLLRAGGFLDRVRQEEDDSAPLSQRTPAELDRLLETSLQRLAELKSPLGGLTAENLATPLDDDAGEDDPEDEVKDDGEEEPEEGVFT